MIVSTDVTEQMNEDLRLLVATGLYKSKSEALRDAIRQLADKYHDRIENVRELRKMAPNTGGKTLSSLVIENRKGEMH